MRALSTPYRWRRLVDVQITFSDGYRTALQVVFSALEFNPHELKARYSVRTRLLAFGSEYGKQ